MDERINRAITIARHEGIRSLVHSVSAFLSNTTARSRHRYREISRQWWTQLRYRDSLADPYRLIAIDPCDVAALTVPHFSGDLPADATHVVGGEWDVTPVDGELQFLSGWERAFDDRGALPLDDYQFYQSVERHIRQERPWHETAFYDWVTTADELPDVWLYAHEETRQLRFEQLDQLAASMRTDGYRTQSQCAEDSNAVPGGVTLKDTAEPIDSVDNRPPEDVPPAYHEVMINIGRDGELFFEEGRHRFSVARALGLDSIPVRVFVRHERWQEKRSRVARATDPSDLPVGLRQHLSHPDMSDVAASLRYRPGRE